jgi:hypothetical protein
MDVVVRDLLASWVAVVVGRREEALIDVDWTDFDADDQTTLAPSLVTRHGRATPVPWLTVCKRRLNR